MARKPPRAVGRAQRYQRRKAAAESARQQLVVAWEWLLAELTALHDRAPGKADEACRALAGQIEAIAQETAQQTAQDRESA